jgi:hypothetical protein
VRVLDCGRAPYKGDGRNQPNRKGARIFHRQLAPSRIRACPQSSFPAEKVNEPRLSP